jgi:hypothetical protein
MGSDMKYFTNVRQLGEVLVPQFLVKSIAIDKKVNLMRLR